MWRLLWQIPCLVTLVIFLFFLTVHAPVGVLIGLVWFAVTRSRRPSTTRV